MPSFFTRQEIIPNVPGFLMTLSIMINKITWRCFTWDLPKLSFISQTKQSAIF